VKLRRLEIHNYKSLRNVVIEPASLSVFVGPNAAGKSNFADALDFLAEVYRWDLEGAVKKKGGFENICFRQAKRSSAPIRFRVVLEIQAGEVPKFFWNNMAREVPGLIFDHTFEIKTRSRSIGAPFFVSLEKLDAGEYSVPLGTLEEEFSRDISLTRTEEGTSGTAEFLGHVREPGASELWLQSVRSFYVWGDAFSDLLASLRIFQINPRQARSVGVPTPNPDLDRFGQNLPAVIDFLKRSHPIEFKKLLESVRRVMPSLDSIETDFTYTRTLGLFLKEAGVSRLWTADDVSDGTIQSIALLTATFDPRIKILVIEEPENSVHPWAIRNFVQAFRIAAEQKQIFLTTHSPILIDQIRPEELWVVQRPALETKITPVLELDPSLQESWGEGRFTLSEYLDSGALPEAVPAPGI
jgi:predicted ATPase